MQKSKNFKKVAVDMERGRPKLEIARRKNLHLRLTDFEFEKISRIAKKKNITRTEAILRGIDLLIAHKPKRYGNIRDIYKKNHNEQEPPPDW